MAGGPNTPQLAPVRVTLVSDAPAQEPVEHEGPLRRFYPAAIAIVVLAGVAFFSWTRSDMWLDEALSVNIARLPLGDLPDALERGRRHLHFQRSQARPSPVRAAGRKVAREPRL